MFSMGIDFFMPEALMVLKDLIEISKRELKTFAISM